MVAAKVVISVCFLVCFCSFAWAARSFFIVNNDGAQKGRVIIGIMGLPSAALYLIEFYRATPNAMPLIVGIILFTMSFALFWWAISTNRSKPLDFAFSENSPTRIVVTGPYKFIRHPFYTSYSLAWFGGAVAAESPILCFAALIFLSVYVHAARQEEGKFLNSRIASGYQEYKQRTGMFVPRL